MGEHDSAQNETPQEDVIPVPVKSARRSRMTLFFWPFSILCIAVVMALLLYVSRAGQGSYKSKVPYVPDEWLVFIDSSNYTYSESNGNKYRGLPDIYDNLKVKDFYAVYGARYCSGLKENGKWRANFCSYGGKEFFSHAKQWKKQTGIDLEAFAGQKPRIIFILLITGLCMSIVNCMLGWMEVYYHLALYLSIAGNGATSGMLVYATLLSRKFGHEMVEQARLAKGNGVGTISVIYGKKGNDMLAAAAGCSLLATISWIILFCFDVRIRRRNPKVIHATDIEQLEETAPLYEEHGAGKGGYDQIRDEGVELPPYSSTPDLHAQSSVKQTKEENTAYEPFRHQALTKAN